MRPNGWSMCSMLTRRTRTGGRNVSARLAVFALLAAGVLAAGCSPAQYALQADRAAYALIQEKQLAALGKGSPFRINEPADKSKPEEDGKRIDTPVRAIVLPDGGAVPMTGAKPARVLTLADCLWIAHTNSRRFQSRKEDLYVQALALANQRHDWNPLGGGVASKDSFHRGPTGATVWDGDGTADLTFTQKLATGGIATLAAGLNFATDFLDIRSTGFGSFVSANFTQPLLRGAWREFAYEDLFRAERDLALAVIEYDRFTQTFAVDTASSYYRVLQTRDDLTNEQDNLTRLQQTAKFVTAQVDAGMISRIQADQADQNVLNAQSRIELVTQRYQDALDGLKLTIGLPMQAAVELDKEELAKLDPLPIPFAEGEAIEVAMRTRPDLLTQRAEVRDRRRDVEMAADAFNPSLDLVLGVRAVGKTPRKPLQVQFHQHTQTAGLELDYQLDQTDNRDSYRNAIIAQARAERNLEELLDRVRMEVRQSYRALVKSNNTYKIQKASAALAGRRTTLTRLEFKEGLASTRDLLEAEDSLRSSRIEVTSALVNYVTTRLSFLAALGMISVDEEGKFYERDEPFYLERDRPGAAAR